MTETVLVDTSALYAYLDAGDEQHPAALDRMHRLLESVVANERVALTHSSVVVESVALVQRRLGMNAVRDLVDEVMAPMTLHFVDAALHDRAVTALLAADRSDISLVDWTSFELMRELQIERSFAFDSDFVEYGFDLYD